ncbi:MAG: DUF6473 family protein [Rubricella sp.]
MSCPIAWPALAAGVAGVPFANWGTPGAGPGAFLRDPVILEACSDARLCIIVLPGAETVSNRLFTVGPRRNARLKGVGERMRLLYPDLPFDTFRTTRAMLRQAARQDADHFALLRLEMQEAWIARMVELVDAIAAPTILLWLRPEAPGLDGPTPLVDPAMVARVEAHADALVSVPLDGAQRLPSHDDHVRIAAALSGTVAALLAVDPPDPPGGPGLPELKTPRRWGEAF